MTVTGQQKICNFTKVQARLGFPGHNGRQCRMCHHKKRKRVRKRSKHIHFLPDDLLLEILCQLRCCKSAIQCKSVCKRWAVLVPGPFFIASFEFGEQNFYICNVQTEQWLSLPTLPFCCKRFSIALTYDPYYSFVKEKDYGGSNVIFNSVYRYSMVGVPYKARRQTMMNACLFSRNNHGGSQWRDNIVASTTLSIDGN